MKRFYVFLDESGDFDRDLDNKGRKACLVGGLLLERERMDENHAYDLVCNNWREYYPGDHNPFRNARHATDIDDEKKGYCIYGLLKKAVERGYSIVLFENDVRAKIVNSSITYIYVLTEGMIQLLHALIRKYQEPVELNLVIGMRKDTSIPVTSSREEGYISRDDYVRRLEERLALERLKNQDRLQKESSIRIQLDDDKKNPYLVICDYVCYSRFRRQANCFSEKIDGTELRQKIQELYHQDEFVFRMFEGEQNRRFNHYVSSGNYSSAFLDICSGNCRKMNAQYILDLASRIDGQILKNHLDSFLYMLKDVIQIKRDLKQGEKLLDGADMLAQELKARKCDVSIFELELYLYRLAILNHRGDLLQMERYFEKAESVLSRALNRVENLEYYFILFNRKAVFLRDDFQYRESIKVCDRLLDKISYYQMLLDDLDLLKAPNEPMKSYQKGAILGTQVYTLWVLSCQEPSYLERAREVSDQAIEAFDQFRDLSRQYQIRAQIENQAHCFDEALRYFCLSLEKVSWQEMFVGEGEIHRFAWYHLSKIMVELSRVTAGDSEKEDWKKTAEQMLAQSIRYADQLRGVREFPAQIILKNIGMSAYYQGRNLSQAVRYLKEALKLCEECDDVSIRAIGLGIYADLMMVLHGSREQKEIAEAFCLAYENFMAGELPKGTREFFKSWEKYCTVCCQDVEAETWERLGRNIVY